MRKHIYIANQSKQKLGGGFVFLDNLRQGSRNLITFVDHWQDAHTIFIPSVTMTARQEILDAKAAKRRIVLRVDNMPKDSRNRGTAFSRMRDYGTLADVIIFQSEWARDYVGSWLESNFRVKAEKRVIYNGVDTSIFYYRDNPKARGDTYLYTTFNTDENKRFPEAAYDFHLRHREAKRKNLPLPSLKLVGNFPKELPPYKFDFFDGENISYTPAVENRKEMGDIYRSCRYLYFPAFADASPNTVGEAIACGCEVLLANPVGGTKEVIEQYSKKIISIEEMADRYIEVL